jgi:hypothetical protein
MPERKQQLLHLLFIGKSGVIGTEGDFHAQRRGFAMGMTVSMRDAAAGKKVSTKWRRWRFPRLPLPTTSF